MNPERFGLERFDPARRRLCPDGACIGVLGEDGRCHECGRRFGPGDEPVEAAPAAASPDVAAATSDAVRDAPPDDETPPRFDPRRRLCPDGTCIGVVDEATGRCRQCGARADAPEPAP